MKISIVTVTLNEAEALRHSLASVAAQGYPDLEHIVVDGHSTDNTASVVAEFPGVKFAQLEPNGTYDALNYGFILCSGDILGFIHGNDAMAHGKVLNTIAKEFEADPDLEFIYGDMRYVKPVTYKHVRIYYAGKFKPSNLLGGIAPAHPTLYIRRRVWEKIGKYRLDFPKAADFEMWIRLFKDKSLKYKYLPLVIAEMTTGGRSTMWSARLLTNNVEKWKALKLNGMPANPFRLLAKYIYVLRNLISAPNYER